MIIKVKNGAGTALPTEVAALTLSASAASGLQVLLVDNVNGYGRKSWAGRRVGGQVLIVTPPNLGNLFQFKHPSICGG